MFVSLLLLVAAATPPDQPVIVEAKPIEEKKICRTQRDTGSRVVKTICKTAAEARKDAEDAKNALNMGGRSNRPPDAFKAPTGN
jgi:hypothetical protein